MDPTQPANGAARRRRPRRSRRRMRPLSRITLNLAPMIDVTFLLLIFFLVTTTFKRPEGIFAAQLPKDAGIPSAALPISPIIVRISQPTPDGDEYQIRIDNFTRAPQSFGELARFLIDIQGNPGFDRQTPVVIYPGRDVRWDHVVNCWNAAVRAKCENITFGGQ
ncbi:MAG TPA: biopolymer transporter ExbD [Phycisphaerae bacterium]|nr:biopolymer transporter ExbD [Phycisphaerae bacterium]